jgi:hypothetical protein
MDRLHRVHRAQRTLRHIACLGVALAAWNPPVPAFGAEHERLSVRVYNTSVSPGTFTAALRDASRILGEVGVDAEWHDCHPAARAARPVPRLCAYPLGQGEVIVQVATAPPGASHPRRLGVALVDHETGTGAFATVFADRIAALARDCRLPYAPLLAGVIVHEIAHLLSPGDDHAPAGLMSGTWSLAGLPWALARGWRFSPADGARMRRTLRSRIDPPATHPFPIASAAVPGGGHSPHTVPR